MDLRLVLVDIERRARNQPLLQRPGQRGFVDHRHRARCSRGTRTVSCARALSGRSDAASRASAARGARRRRTSLSSRSSDMALGARASSLSLTCCDTRPACRSRAPGRATARAMRPSPTSPSCLPLRLGAQHEVERPAFPAAAPDSDVALGSRRVIARISAHVKSATASVSTSGVFVTMMSRLRAKADVDVVVANRHVRDDLE